MINEDGGCDKIVQRVGAACSKSVRNNAEGSTGQKRIAEENQNERKLINEEM